MSATVASTRRAAIAPSSRMKLTVNTPRCRLVGVTATESLEEARPIANSGCFSAWSGGATWQPANRAKLRGIASAEN
ncbi:hypothetical protein D3C87_2122510 [compost metagenome]